MTEIYLVHDDLEGPDSRKIFLEMAGYEVSTMQGGRECLERMSEKLPALVISDVLIHGMTGFELLEQIRRLHPPEQLPVVLCTEFYGASNFRAEARRLGAQAYHIRPYPLDALVNEIVEQVQPQKDSDKDDGGRQVA